MAFRWMILYVVISWAVMLFNKWVLSIDEFNFPFPITLEMIHMALSGFIAFILIHVFRVVPSVNMTRQIYEEYVIPISYLSALNLWVEHRVRLHISMAFIQMLKVIVPLMTSMDVGWFRTLRLRWPQFEIMLLNCVAVTIALYGEILFDKFGTDQWQLTGIILETRRVVLIEMLLQRQDLFLHPVTSMYYIAPCSLVCLFIPWCFLERPAMLASTFWNQSSFWVFLTTNAAFALVLNFVSLLMIQRTSALRYWVALVVKDWMLVALLPKKTIFDKVSYTIVLGGAMKVYNYLTRIED